MSDICNVSYLAILCDPCLCTHAPGYWCGKRTIDGVLEGNCHHDYLYYCTSAGGSLATKLEYPNANVSGCNTIGPWTGHDYYDNPMIEKKIKGSQRYNIHNCHFTCSSKCQPSQNTKCCVICDFSMAGTNHLRSKAN